MLKFLFWILLLANAGLAAYQLGYLDRVLPSGHEPSRLQQQILPDRIRIVPPPGQATPAPASEAPAAPVQTAAASTEAGAACIEIGNFSAQEAQRFAAQLGELAQRATRRQVQEVASHMVYIPPQADRDGAERKAEELRQLGVTDFFIIQDNSSLRWGISLGVFKTEEGARTHLAELTRSGVRSARIGQRTVNSTQIVFEFRDLDGGARAVLEQARDGFARQELRECKAA